MDGGNATQSLVDLRLGSAALVGWENIRWKMRRHVTAWFLLVRDRKVDLSLYNLDHIRTYENDTVNNWIRETLAYISSVDNKIHTKVVSLGFTFHRLYVVLYIFYISFKVKI